MAAISSVRPSTISAHLAVAPDFLPMIEKNDKAFAASEFLPHMRWLTDINDDLYDPTYTDMLRVAVHLRVSARKASGLGSVTVGPQLRDQAIRRCHRRGGIREAQEGHPCLHEQDPLRPHHDDPALGGFRHAGLNSRSKCPQLRLHPLPAWTGRTRTGGGSGAAGAALVRHVDPARALHGKPGDRL